METTHRPAVGAGLLAVEKFAGTIAEPACGKGHIADVFVARHFNVIASDLIERGYGKGGVDFLKTETLDADNIVTNPPYELWTEFAAHAAELIGDRGKIALYAPVRYLCGIERVAMFAATKLSRAWFFPDRQKTTRNGWTDTGNGSQVDTCWLIWDPAHRGDPTFGWC